MFVLKLRYGAELVDTLLLESQRVTPAALAHVGFTFRNPVLAGALESVLR
jgi:NAD dependent epimerase/dehydratase family enzyme